MKKYAVIALVMLLIPSMAFAGGAEEEKSEYVFATDATWPPFEYIDENGNLTGFEVELVPMIGEAVGETFVVQNIPWDTIFAGLKNGQYDGVASGVTVTEERKATIDFSTPINNQGQVLIIPTAKASEVGSIDELPEGSKVGVQIGTTGDFALEDYPVEIRRYDDIGLAIEDMLNGNLDGNDYITYHIWQQDYKLIAQANLILTHSGRAKANGVNENVINRYRAEAYFARACKYAELMAYFGDVPYVDKPLTISLA